MSLQLATQTLAGAIAGSADRARNFSRLSLGFASANFRTRFPLGSHVHIKSESVKGGAFDLLRIKALRNTLIASGIISSAWDGHQFFMPIYGRAHGLSATAIGSIVGYAPVFLTNAGLMVLGGDMSLRNHARR